ncbi:MAG: glycosyltransferase family 2 protein [Planctomycetota bacterium]|nr:MAG: glycosyltransferase family 2 protein [Planctomycetota bacterium]
MPSLSIVVPAYNEAARIIDSLERIGSYLQHRGGESEVVVVDDGSEDETADLVAAYAAEHPQVCLLRVPHGGKGQALRAGVLAARGEYVFICDADLSMPVEQIERFLPPASDPCDVAIGSRELPGSRRYGEPRRRHLMGRAFNAWVRLMAVRGLQDTQCGFKCFRRAVARDLFGAQRLGGWAFDVELLFLARRRGYTIREVPIDWHYREGSKIRPLRDARAMFCDVLRLRLNSLLGRYDEPAPGG